MKASTIPEIALKIAALQKVNSKHQRMVVITQGAKSVIVAHGIFIHIYY